MHYRRWRRTGSSYGRKTGEPFVNYHGYRVLHRPDHPLSNGQGHVLEHRLVAWETFGPFPVAAVVHHRNADRLDNRPENLEVMTPSEHHLEHHRRLDPMPYVRLRAEGLSLPEIRDRTGTNTGTIHRVIRRWVHDHPAAATTLGLLAPSWSLRYPNPG